MARSGRGAGREVACDVGAGTESTSRWRRRPTRRRIACSRPTRCSVAVREPGSTPHRSSRTRRTRHRLRMTGQRGEVPSKMVTNDLGRKPHPSAVRSASAVTWTCGVRDARGAGCSGPARGASIRCIGDSGVGASRCPKGAGGMPQQSRGRAVHSLRR